MSIKWDLIKGQFDAEEELAGSEWATPRTRTSLEEREFRVHLLNEIVKINDNLREITKAIAAATLQERE